jgi:RND family efflux transporter MFP subunit
MLSRRSKRAWIGLLLLGGLVTTLFFAVGRYFEGLAEQRRYEEERAEVKPRPPHLHTVKRENRVRLRRYTAELAPWTDASLAVEVPGTVIETPVETGQSVKEGDVLLRLDPTMAELAVRASEAQHAEARRLAEEAATLAERKVASQTELAAAQSRAVVSEAQLAREKENLARHTLKAPFSGVIDRRLVDVGDPVTALTPVIRMADLSRLRVVFYVAQKDVEEFEKGELVRVEVPGVPGVFEASLLFAGRVADPDTRMVRMEAELPNPGNKLPGRAQGIVEAEVGSYSGALFVPVAAVRITGDSLLVERRTEDGSSQLVEIQAGPELDGAYPVFSGLNEGDQIFIR